MAHPNSLKRLASGGVDPEAERYWTEYYGDYGEQLVREVKSRVATLARERFRTAADAPVAWYPTAHAASGEMVQFEGLAQVIDPTGRTRTAALSLSYSATGKLVDSRLI